MNVFVEGTWYGLSVCAYPLRCVWSIDSIRGRSICPHVTSVCASATVASGLSFCAAAARERTRSGPRGPKGTRHSIPYTRQYIQKQHKATNTHTKQHFHSFPYHSLLSFHPNVATAYLTRSFAFAFLPDAR